MLPPASKLNNNCECVWRPIRHSWRISSSLPSPSLRWMLLVGKQLSSYARNLPRWATCT